VHHPSDAEFLEFDDRNETHLAERGVAAVEVQQVFFNDPLWAENLKGRTGTWLMIGTNGGRPMLIAVVYDEIRRALRPVTARTCDPDEVTKWDV
jgi:uncharacterized DUF497 family protein